MRSTQEIRREREELLKIGQRRCSKCQEKKALAFFSKDKYKGDGYQPECKKCNASYYQKNKQKYHDGYRKRYLADTVEYLKNNANRKYKHRYGITTEEKNKMIADQKNKCLICSEEFEGTKDQCVDHDHTTKKVRGILCDDCNKGIGHFKDNFELLVAASKYVLSFKE